MYNIKHLMTGPKGNSEFCRFPRDPQCCPKPRGTSRGNKTRCFPWGHSLSVLLYLPTQNRTIHGYLHGICRCFKGARPDHVRVESSSRCFLRDLLSFDP